jgi:hypothetical protein
MLSSYQHTGNTNTGIASIRLSILYKQPQNKQLPLVIVINVVQIVFYNSTRIT